MNKRLSYNDYLELINMKNNNKEDFEQIENLNNRISALESSLILLKNDKNVGTSADASIDIIDLDTNKSLEYFNIVFTGEMVISLLELAIKDYQNQRNELIKKYFNGYDIKILKPGDLVYDDDAVSHKIPEGYIGVVSEYVGQFLLDPYSSINVAVIKTEDLDEFLHCEELTENIWKELEKRDPNHELRSSVGPDLVEKYNLHDVLGYDLSELVLCGEYIMYDILGCTVEEEYEL